MKGIGVPDSNPKPQGPNPPIYHIKIALIMCGWNTSDEVLPFLIEKQVGNELIWPHDSHVSLRHRVVAVENGALAGFG